MDAHYPVFPILDFRFSIGPSKEAVCMDAHYPAMPTSATAETGNFLDRFPARRVLVQARTEGSVRK